MDELLSVEFSFESVVDRNYGSFHPFFRVFHFCENTDVYNGTMQSVPSSCSGSLRSAVSFLGSTFTKQPEL